MAKHNQRFLFLNDLFLSLISSSGEDSFSFSEESDELDYA